MTSSRLILVSALSLLLVVFAACNKEPPRPITPSPQAPQPSAAPTAPVAPSAGAPAAPPSPSAPSGASAQEAEQLAGKSGCLACHSVDKKIVGPAYKDVAVKYRGQPDAEAKLTQKVKNGGAGVWGQVPMPPNTQVGDADIKKMVDWILSLK
ncbi:MAG TPA: c-type cytochrome [Burkholderiales bacterium]|nr:c-type cytochrome [Burkholderiales bacterium]